MSLWSRLTNLFNNDRLTRELDEELESHLAEAIEQGRTPQEARKAFGGSPLLHREHSRDIKLFSMLDGLRADAIFGWRQLIKNKITSASAILSLALAIGSCTAAFRLIDAVLLRPLPIRAPEQLYSLSRHGMGFDGKPMSYDSWAYPAFELMRDAVKDQAELIAVSNAERMDITYSTDQEMEKAEFQHVSGSMFPSFGLHPAVGRLFTEADDRKPRAHPYAVLSHSYWTRRFGGDPKVIGRTLHLGDSLLEIIGVAEPSFTGTEPGIATDIFLPTMMHPSVTQNDSTWHRTLARVHPGASLEAVSAKLFATSYAFESERLKGIKNKSPHVLDILLKTTLVLEPAATGSSDLQREFRPSLIALGALVAMVLLIACSNIANLMMAQAASRSREMALRLSIGAGRARLVQLVLVESAWIAFLAAIFGTLFAWWSTPFVVSMLNPPDNPAHLSLPWDWRVLSFGLVLTFAVTFLCGLTPALRASSIQPSTALKGGKDPHSRRRLMHVLIAAQVAFCFVVLFASGLFTASFERLSHRPLGFSADRLLTLETIASQPQSPVAWEQLAEHLRTTPGVEMVALAARPLLGGGAWNSFISVTGQPPGPVLAFFLSVSPGFIDVMKCPLIDGHDFRPGDSSGADLRSAAGLQAGPSLNGAAIVNETFAKQYFNDESPVGKTFERGSRRYEIVGLVRDAPYRSLREPILPVAYVPIRELDAAGAFQPVRRSTFIVRTSSANPLSFAPALRQAIPAIRHDFRVSNIRSQEEINQSQTVRERLLAMLALFFAIVALLLAAIGLYGVLDYGVLQRRREFGIRIAIGAPALNIARLVGSEVFGVILIGAVAGLAAGMASVRYFETLLYQVKATDTSMLAIPSLTILTAALLAALPAVIHAVRLDPVKMLRSE